MNGRSPRFEITIEKIVAGGEGLGRRQGHVVFVPRAAPGDRLLVEPVETRRDYVRARIIEIRDPSSERREPPCPFYPLCGGCSLMHMEPAAQVESKRRILIESLRRGGRLEYEDDVIVLEGPESGYRSRARFHIRHLKRARVPWLLGFRERGSHRIVDITHCLQISLQANAVLRELRRWLAEKPDRARNMVSAEILEPCDGFSMAPPGGEESTSEPGRILLHFVVKRGRSPARSDLQDLVEGARLRGLVVSEEGRPGWRHRLGQSRLVHRVSDLDYRTRVGSFFQVNRYLLDKLVTTVVTPLPSGSGTVVDLYCGVGLFTLPMARAATRVVGVESSSPAILDGRANARRVGLGQVEFVESEAGDYAAHYGFQGVDTVIVDPPRGGLGALVVAALVEHPPRELRYVSCDPAALGRDAGRVARGGLLLQGLVLLDMFPNTHHFETVATFRSR